MPIVIRELVIRARVEENEKPFSEKKPGSADTKGSGVNEMDIEKIVALCVEKTMEVIQRKSER